MSSFSVTFSKLKKYCEEQGDYDLEVKDGAVTLRFVPTFPEALEKSESVEAKTTLLGVLLGDKVEFTKAEIENGETSRVRDKEEAQFVYQAWLDYIENNY